MTGTTGDKSGTAGTSGAASHLEQLLGGSRRDFFKATVGFASLAALVACGDDDDDGITQPPPGDDDDEPVSLGSGNIGVLNYAYALEQLEAAFYVAVLDDLFSDATEVEEQLLTDLRDHEVAHRDFFAAALGDSAIPALEVDFSAVDFGSRASVLQTAQTFEDLGVSAYNGAGRLFTDDDTGRGFLTAAGKIVSVEARHAAAIRSVFAADPRAFAGDDVVAPDTGLDVIRRPPAVLEAAAGFIVTEIDASGLPTAPAP